jgi:hypothetical protein
MTMALEALTFPASRRLSRRIWARWRREILASLAFTAAGLLAATLRDYANHTSIPHQRDSVASLDRLIGFGTTPTERLQGWLYSGHAGLLDGLCLALHISWFFAPALLTAYIVFRRWDLVPSYAIARTGILYVSLVAFFLLPTEPPWMALHVHRVLAMGHDAPVNADWNTVAAFPSLHVAVPAVQAFWLRSRGMGRLAAAFGVYTILTALMAVYTGEHYVTDALAGAALAYGMVRLSSVRWGAFDTRAG